MSDPSFESFGFWLVASDDEVVKARFVDNVDVGVPSITLTQT